MIFMQLTVRLPLIIIIFSPTFIHTNIKYLVDKYWHLNRKSYAIKITDMSGKSDI